MLIKLDSALTKNVGIKVSKYCKNENASRKTPIPVGDRGAFPSCTKLYFKVKCPREFGVMWAEMNFHRDGETGKTVEMKLCGEEYCAEIDLSREGEGLYFYSFTLQRGRNTLYSTTAENCDVFFTEKEGTQQRLLVYEDGFKTPEWFPGGVMYHIFVDRFYSSGKSPKNTGAENETNWYAPVSQFGETPGAPVKNNLFFGGDLWGVREKLPYLKEMGVTVLYLSPIFSAASNHKYDTSDYTEIDSCFGGKEAFESLLDNCRKYNIRVILDGVFNHTGDESVYFDKCRKYGNGTYENENSPYREWYCFEENGKYKCWWGVEILPKLNHENEECRKYFTSENGIGARYVKEGIGGWRLDVADELSDKFLDEFRESVKRADPDAIIIGEVWENAADKESYGHRRRYLRGKQLDSVMNYPFRTALIGFLTSGDGSGLARELRDIYSSYPKCVSDSLMNILGTHDTDRILTVLGDEKYKELSNRELSTHYMSWNEYEKGKTLLFIAAAIQYTVYGVPSVFYGDEVGMQGGRDPFCRRPYPWGKEDGDIVNHYRTLGEIRKNEVFKNGDFSVISSGDGYIVFERSNKDTRIITAANVGNTPLHLDYKGTELLTGEFFNGIVQPYSAVIISVN